MTRRPTATRTPAPTAPDTFESLIADWLASARAAGRSLRTLESYRWPVNNVLLPTCRREGITSPAEIDRRFLDRLNTSLLDSQLAPASVRTYLRQINVFLRHVFRHSYCTQLLRKNVSPAKVMQLLGHGSMQMVMEVYNQLQPADAAGDVIHALGE